MEEEAVLKRHSTVGEAIRIARKMNAKSMILTHFSQRYPKIPPLKGPAASTNVADSMCNDGSQSSADNDFPIAFAFDLMRLTPHTVSVASKLTPALRLLYPGEDGCDEESDGMMMDALPDDKKSSVKDLMAVPGVFAAKGVL